MSWQRVSVQFALLFALVLVPGGLADEPKQPDPKKDDKQEVKSMGQKTEPAKAIDFRKELGLPFPSLGTLGGRIDAAKRAHDPVSLSHAASELAVAEKVSGKKAKLTSNAVIKQAAQLAQLRRQATELQATLQVADQVASEQSLITSLKEQIASANKQAKDEAESIQRNEEPTGPRRLVINNYTTQYMDIWVNGYLKLQVPPGGSKWCMIEHKWNPTVLTAYGDEDTTTWGPRYIWGNFKTYKWNLN